MRKKMRGGSSFWNNDFFLGPSYNMNSATAFGTSPGAVWSQNTVGGSPQNGPYTNYSIPVKPLV